MKSVRLKKFLKRTIFTDLVSDVFDGRHPFDIDDHPPGAVRNFGSANPDKVFYVIWRDSLGSGFFSNFTQVLSHIQFAEGQGMIPVADFENFRTLYNVDEAVHGSRNAWEYYFEPLSPYPLAEVYRSRNVVFCSGSRPEGPFFATDAEYRAFVGKHIRIRPWVEERIRRYETEFSARKVLGIHFRGKEINTSAGHAFGPTVAQVIRHADDLLDRFGLERIFLVTEEAAFVEPLRRRYGDRLFMTDAFRVKKVNSYNLSPRPQHRYLLGLEVLADTLLLSRSRAILCSHTGVAMHAVRMAEDLDFVRVIDNGVNCRGHLLAHYAYPIRRILPKMLGGLRDEAVDFTREQLQKDYFDA